MPSEEINALLRACPYSFPPNKLGYCGPKQSWLSFQAFLSNPTKENAAAAKENLRQFSALSQYLELIAKANSLQPFDAEVIEAYWLGNSLLENVQHREIQKTILSLQKHGLPKHVAEEKAANLPEGMLPHHSMHVLYVNFLSPKVKPIVRNLSGCLVQWGEMEGKTGKGLRIRGIGLFPEAGELKLKEKKKTVQNPFNLNLQQDDFVSVHWGNAIEKISSAELERLKAHTFKNMNALNSCGFPRE